MARGGGSHDGGMDVDATLLRTVEMHGYKKAEYDRVKRRYAGLRAPTSVTLDEPSALAAQQRIDSQKPSDDVWARFGSSKYWHYVFAVNDGQYYGAACDSTSKSLDKQPAETSKRLTGDMQVCFKCLVEATGHQHDHQAYVKGSHPIRGMGQTYGRKLKCSCGYRSSTNEGAAAGLQWAKEDHLSHVISELQLDGISDQERYASRMAQLREDHPKRAAFLAGLREGDLVVSRRDRDSDQGRQLRLVAIRGGSLPYVCQYTIRDKGYQGDVRESTHRVYFDRSGADADADQFYRPVLCDPADHPGATPVLDDRT